METVIAIFMGVLAYLLIGMLLGMFVIADEEINSSVSTFIIVTCWPFAILVIMYAVCYIIGSKLVEKLGGE